jgi:hypothetical protein
MKYALSCYFDNAKYVLEAIVTRRHAALMFSGTPLFDSDYQTFMELIKDYNTDDMVNGPPFIERKLFQILQPIAKEMPAQILVRCFAVISRYLSLEFLENARREADSYNNINEQCNNVFFHFSMVEWTGGLGAQPTMYFIKKERVENKPKAIESLFQIGLLHQVDVHTDLDITSYYIPFELPSVRRVQISSNLHFWNEILDDRNDEIKAFVEGRRKIK